MGAAAALLIITLVSCFCCSCCFLYKKRHPSSSKTLWYWHWISTSRQLTIYLTASMYRLHNTSEHGSGVTNMYSISNAASRAATPMQIGGSDHLVLLTSKFLNSLWCSAPKAIVGCERSRQIPLSFYVSPLRLCHNLLHKRSILRFPPCLK